MSEATGRMDIPMPKYLSESNPFQDLHKLCKEKGQKIAALDLGFSPQYINDVLLGRREISAALASKLGYKQVTMYIKTEQTP